MFGDQATLDDLRRSGDKCAVEILISGFKCGQRLFVRVD